MLCTCINCNLIYNRNLLTRAPDHVPYRFRLMVNLLEFPFQTLRLPMVRRVPTQVHKQVARLAQTGYIQREPLWYRAVLEHPPLPLPARAPANRFPSEFERHAKPYDLPQTIEGASSHLKKPKKVRAEQIVYLEDQVRRQFFRDHPFEAFRERSLVEEDRIEDEHPINGAEWTRLSQRTRNPNSEEYASIVVSIVVPE